MDHPLPIPQFLHDGDFLGVLKAHGYETAPRLAQAAAKFQHEMGKGSIATEGTTVLAVKYKDGVLVAGDRRGHVGWGFGKANEVADAIRKGTDQAKKSMVSINRRNSTIPHEVIGVFGGGRVLLRPASPGTGVIAGGGVRAVIEAAGVRDVLTKSLGSSNAVNVVKATIDALLQLRPREEIFRVRGLARQASAGVS